MKIRFWGVRGSIAAPGPQTVRYGGNTTCIEIGCDDGQRIILDAGTGIFPLSQTLMREQPLTAHVFITHSHWDHIQGLPFFLPNFIPGNRLCLYGGLDPISGCGIEEVLAVQLQYRFFPVRVEEIKADIDYITLAPGQSVQLGQTLITPHLLNHPVLNFGYRIECAGKSVFFTGDFEPPANLYAPDDASFADYQSLIDQRNADIERAMQGVDVLIADSAYTSAEFVSRRGWGHGSFETSMALARAAGARVLLCTHHEPTRSDAALEQVFAEACALAAHSGAGSQVRLAREGEVFEF